MNSCNIHAFHIWMHDKQILNIPIISKQEWHIQKAHKWQNVLSWCVNYSIWATKCLLWFQVVIDLSLNMIMLNINLYALRSLFQNIDHPCEKHLHNLTLFSTHSWLFKQICCVNQNSRKHSWTTRRKIIEFHNNNVFTRCE
jgi:hypothetical protein